MALYLNGIQVGSEVTYEIGHHKLSLDIIDTYEKGDSANDHNIVKQILDDIHDFDKLHSGNTNKVIVPEKCAAIIYSLLSKIAVILNELSCNYNYISGKIILYNDNLNVNIYKSYQLPNKANNTDRMPKVYYRNSNNQLLSIT